MSMGDQYLSIHKNNLWSRYNLWYRCRLFSALAFSNSETGLCNNQGQSIRQNKDLVLQKNQEYLSQDWQPAFSRFLAHNSWPLVKLTGNKTLVLNLLMILTFLCQGFPVHSQWSGTSLWPIGNWAMQAAGECMKFHLCKQHVHAGNHLLPHDAGPTAAAAPQSWKG